MASAPEDRLADLVAMLGIATDELEALAVGTQSPPDVVGTLGALVDVAERLNGVIALGRLFHQAVAIEWEPDGGSLGTGWATELAKDGARLDTWQASEAGAAHRAEVLGLTRRTEQQFGVRWTAE